MLQRRFHIFVLTSHGDAKSFRVSLPYSALIAIGIIVLSVFLAAGLAGYHYGAMLLKVGDYNKLLAANDSFLAENQDYRIQTAQLGEKIDSLETTSRKLMILSGMSSRNAQGGVGGFSKDSFSKPLPSPPGSLQAIDSYNKSVSALEERYQSLNHWIRDRALYASATPSIMPVVGYVTAQVGMRGDPFNNSAADFHSGVDISAPYGSKVIAPADGTILFAGQRAGYGNIVVIDHKFGLTTRYGHLWKINVQVGQHVSRNDVLGYVGTSGRTTGPHLHFELWVHNRPVNPLDFIRRANPQGLQATAGR